ncbi:PGPGW domain-containing protein [Colwelliaceae bacterium 6471]
MDDFKRVDMQNSVKKLILTLTGGLLVILGVIFILIPGPAILFLPLGLALLSLEYPWAKKCLRNCQRWMRKSAVKVDQSISWFKRRYL